MGPVSSLAAALLVAALPFLGAPALAVEPADRDIAAALADIDRYEQELGGLSSAPSATVNRVKRLLGLSRERLDGSPNRDHPSWAEADQRLAALLAHLDALAAGGTAATAGVSPPAASQPETPAAAAAASPARAEMISQDRARIARLKREIDSAIDTLDRGGVLPFQDPAYVAEREATAARLQEDFARFNAFSDDPEVQAAAAGLERLAAMMAFGREQAAAQLAEIGNVQAVLGAADARLAAMALPPTPTRPYASGEVQAWLVAIAQLRQAAATDAQGLETLKTRAYLPETRGTPEQGAAYDMQDLQRLQAGFVRQARAVDEAFQQFTADLDLQVAQLADELAFFDAIDPQDPQAQANVLLGQGQAEEMTARLAEMAGLVQTAIEFDQSLGRENDRAAILARVRAATADYAAKRALALESVRLPRAASDEAELVEIARTTLANPDYAVGPIERLVVNVDRRAYEMETSDIEIDQLDVGLGGTVTASGTQTTYRYAWEQFQVATAEPVGDRHYIFYNTLKYFTSGAPTTPLGRWILAERLQTVEIPAANIPLD